METFFIDFSQLLIKIQKAQNRLAIASALKYRSSFQKN